MNKFVDDGDRSNSKVSKSQKEEDAPEVEVVNRQMAPKVSVKVERSLNLGNYNSVDAQVFMSSGTLEEFRGDLLNDDGEIKESVQQELNQITSDLQELARNRIIDALKKEAERDLIVDKRGEA